MNNRTPEITKQNLIKAFDASASKSVTELCRIAGVSRRTFYHHLNSDAAFRKTYFRKQQSHLVEKIAAA